MASGIRYDLIFVDRAAVGITCARSSRHHVSGQMKVAPEHTEDHVLSKMGKPGQMHSCDFKERFDRLSKAAGRAQFLTYYMIAAHPGCTEQDMLRLKTFTSQKLKVNPEQVQIFTPTPSTYSSLMYYTEMDPFTRQPIFVEKDPRAKNTRKISSPEKGAVEDMETFFAVTAPGLERITTEELNRLGMKVSKNPPVDVPRLSAEESGGVEFEGSRADLYRANYQLRTASRVLVRMETFYAAAFSELRKKASRLGWENFLKPGDPVTLHVTCHKSKLYHSDAVAERVLGAIGDKLGKLSVQKKAEETTDGHPPQLVVVRLVNDQCTISIDSSGELLHRRGYRLETAKAPLRETLAAGMLLASGWDAQSPLLDPFCGSGTIAIEAALLARGVPARPEPLVCLYGLAAFRPVEMAKQPVRLDSQPA